MNRLLHTMIRVNDLEASIAFYTDVLGMKLLRKNDNPEFKYTLAFLSYGDDSSEIELTYNWGKTGYEHGNAFGHIAIGVDDIYKTCEVIKSKGVALTREAGPVKGGTSVIAFLKDPDGYSIELIDNKNANHGIGAK